MRIVESLAEFLYPSNAVCVGCGDLTGADHDGLCEACEEKIERLRERVHENFCIPGMIDIAIYAFPYEEPIAHMVRQFKYQGEGNLSRWMAAQMLAIPGAEEMLRRCDGIAFAPADRFRRSKRGYNQAQLLAKEIGKRTGLPVLDVLTRRPFVRPQARLGREERLKNLDGAIHCHGNLSGRHILLIDDVRTTGATAVACAMALRQSGAENVELMTFAAANSRA